MQESAFQRSEGKKLNRVERKAVIFFSRATEGLISALDFCHCLNDITFFFLQKHIHCRTVINILHSKLKPLQLSRTISP